VKNVIIIGSGFSSLASACYMAKAGFEVTVLEKMNKLAGRASMLEIAWFKFDMGPSWYWMPDIFEIFCRFWQKSFRLLSTRKIISWLQSLFWQR
jgi:phytoene desaturase